MAVKYNSSMSWGYFPYPPNYSEDRTNHGGFDLTKNPELIDKIKELEELPRLKESILALNQKNTPFMTTGFLCDKTESDPLFSGYIEFCFRPGIDYSSITIDNLDESFVVHALDKYGQQVADFYQKEFHWEMHVGTVHGLDPVHVYSVYFRARSYDEAEQELLPLLNWLQNNFLDLVP